MNFIAATGRIVGKNEMDLQFAGNGKLRRHDRTQVLWASQSKLISESGPSTSASPMLNIIQLRLQAKQV